LPPHAEQGEVDRARSARDGGVWLGGLAPGFGITRFAGVRNDTGGVVQGRPGAGRDYFVVDAGVRRTGHRGKLWETRLLGDEVRKNQPYFVNI